MNQQPAIKRQSIDEQIAQCKIDAAENKKRAEERKVAFAKEMQTESSLQNRIKHTNEMYAHLRPPTTTSDANTAPLNAMQAMLSSVTAITTVSEEQKRKETELALYAADNAIRAADKRLRMAAKQAAVAHAQSSFDDDMLITEAEKHMDETSGAQDAYEQYQRELDQGYGIRPVKQVATMRFKQPVQPVNEAKEAPLLAF